MQAAVGCAQLAKFPSFVNRRKENFTYLKEGMAGLTDYFILPEACEHADPSWFGFMLTCKGGVERKKVVSYLEDHGVQTRMLFAGNLTKHPCFDQMREEGKGFRVVGDLANTDYIMEHTFWIGTYPGMTKEKLDRMLTLLHEAVGRS